MPLSREQRIELAERYAPLYYPQTCTEDVSLIVERAVEGFKGGYSPLPEEWPLEDGIGRGQTFEEFTIHMGSVVTGIKPTGISDQEFGRIEKLGL